MCYTMYNELGKQPNGANEMTKTTTTKKQTTCPRCDGTGTISEYAHIQDGQCFKCNGTGAINYRKPATKKVNVIKEARTAQYQIVRKSYLRKIAGLDKVWNSPRMTVEKNHPDAEIHAMEVFEWHERWGW